MESFPKLYTGVKAFNGLKRAKLKLIRVQRIRRENKIRSFSILAACEANFRSLFTLSTIKWLICGDGSKLIIQDNYA